jgi:hypothetical protein
MDALSIASRHGAALCATRTAALYAGVQRVIHRSRLASLARRRRPHGASWLDCDSSGLRIKNESGSVDCGHHALGQQWPLLPVQGRWGRWARGKGCAGVVG